MVVFSLPDSYVHAHHRTRSFLKALTKKRRQLFLGILPEKKNPISKKGKV